MPLALKAGVADHRWTIEELIKLIDSEETEKEVVNNNG
jgi:hypothetical protein